MYRIDALPPLPQTFVGTTIADAQITTDQRTRIEAQARAALADLRAAFGHDIAGAWPQLQLRFRTAAEAREAFPLGGAATAAWVASDVDHEININVDHPDLKAGDSKLFKHVLMHEAIHALTRPFLRRLDADETQGTNRALSEAWIDAGKGRITTNVPAVLSEGLTEYFARRQSGFPGGLSKQYDVYARLAAQVVERVGEPTVRLAFFGNDRQAYAQVVAAGSWLARKSALDHLPPEITPTQPTRPGMPDIRRLVLQHQLGLSSPLFERVRAAVGDAAIQRAASLEDADIKPLRDALVRIVGRLYDESR
jgi:hypothetical protein